MPSSVSLDFDRVFETSSISLADNRSFLACSAGPNTSDRSFDLLDFMRLDRRPLPMLPNDVILDTPSSLVSSF